MRKRCKS